MVQRYILIAGSIGFDAFDNAYVVSNGAEVYQPRMPIIIRIGIYCRMQMQEDSCGAFG